MTSKLRDVYVHETKNQKHLNLDGFLGFPLVSFGFSLAELRRYVPRPESINYWVT